jgi:hypothetical protein
VLLDLARFGSCGGGWGREAEVALLLEAGALRADAIEAEAEVALVLVLVLVLVVLVLVLVVRPDVLPPRITFPAGQGAGF